MSAALSRKCAALRALAASGGYGPAAPLALLLDMDALRERVGALRTAFPEPHWHHCFAVKANPTRLVLAEAVALGMGLEAASIGELRQAKRAGCPMDKVVYDSPLKAPDEVAECLREGAALNIDNLQELDQVAEALSSGRVTLRPHQRIGVRVNPQVGAGSLSGYSTGTATSKFGVGLRDHDGAPVAAAYERYEWLNCIMCHVGSQGVSVDLAVAGIEAVVRFALDVNRTLGRRQIRHLDIGGGLAVNFSSDEHRPTFAHYADALRATVPELFQPTLWDSVATEFGRALCAKIGFFASRVEYVKETGGRRIAVQYLGGDCAIRTVYHPNDWPLRISVLDGALAERGPVDVGVTDVAGPLCVQADIIAHQRELPRMQRGDTVLVHDVGGYYHSAKSTYNLRAAPAVWAYQGGDEALALRCLQAQQSTDSMLDAFCEPGYTRQ